MRKTKLQRDKIAMTMTSSERQWVTRVMHTISSVAFMDTCSILAEIIQKAAGDNSPKRRTELHLTAEAGRAGSSDL
jgi:hypothetical protein